MKKRLLMIGYNYFPEPTGIGKYSGEMVSWFVKQGYDCTVVTSYPYYPFWKVQEPYHKKRRRYSVEKSNDPVSGGKLQIYRCPQYVPKAPSGLKRIILDLSFLISAALPLFRLLFGKRFDYVMAVAPAFQVGLYGIMFRKLHGAKFLYHIQDLQIEAAKDFNLIKSKHAIDLLFRVERMIFNNCDVISTISPGMVAKVKNKAKKEVVLFPNWTDVKSFFPVENKAEIKRKYSFSPSDKIILYSGAIGEKQGLDSILVIANQLRNLTDIKFIICGSGPYKQELQRLADRMQVQNVRFMPLQEPSEFNDFLNLADIHLVLQKSSAVDLVMPSKLSTILAVGGLAIVTANPGSGLYTLIRDHEIGVLVNTDNVEELKECILNLIRNDFSHININARKYAENYLRGDKILNAYEAFIQNGRNDFENASPKIGRLSSKIAAVPEPK